MALYIRAVIISLRSIYATKRGSSLPSQQYRVSTQHFALCTHHNGALSDTSIEFLIQHARHTLHVT